MSDEHTAYLIIAVLVIILVIMLGADHDPR